MEQNDIKSLNPIECPHCHKNIVVEFTTAAPKLTGTYTPEMLEAAKAEVLAKIAELNLPEEMSKSTIDWIKDPNTIFGPNDVQTIIDNIPKQDGEDDLE
jgi:hypothetical protein